MKVLHCNSEDIKGGAAIAAHRLHCALRKYANIDSCMGVQFKRSNDEYVFKLKAFTPNILQYFVRRASSLNVRLHSTSKEIPFTAYLWPNFIANAIKKIQPDIIHLHWISQFISPWTLRQIAKLNIPVVWTLHDTWAFTGGCHFGKCTQWQEECRSCPILKNIIGFNISHTQWKAKQKAYAALQPHIITPSLSMQQRAQKSSLLKNQPITHIPNALDIQTFQSIPKAEARKALNLEQDAHFILFGAMHPTLDYNKGYDLLQEALHYIPSIYSKVSCLILGASEGEPLPIPSTFLGCLSDPKTIALAYAAADVFVCPSREENLPNTIMESLACGTPVVGFDIGGIPDMISHKENGYIATPYDTQDLAKGIAYILEDEDRRQILGQAARATVEENYAYPVVAQQYVKLYENILAKHKK